MWLVRTFDYFIYLGVTFYYFPQNNIGFLSLKIDFVSADFVSANSGYHDEISIMLHFIWVFTVVKVSILRFLSTKG